MKSKKTAAGAAVVYLLLTGGLWMFVRSYASFRTRLSGEGRAVSVETSPDGLTAELLGSKIRLDLSLMDESSRSYLPAYLAAPDELRAWAFLCGVVDQL
ncbi:MAG: hypothetical protein KBI35_08045 [Ruminococcus sp.]|nr:hypothetical protein [Ruminococcus sp.]